MRCIDKQTMIQLVANCRAEYITLNRLQIWASLYGQEYMPPTPTNPESQTNNQENKEKNEGEE